LGTISYAYLISRVIYANVKKKQKNAKPFNFYFLFGLFLFFCFLHIISLTSSSQSEFGNTDVDQVINEQIIFVDEDVEKGVQEVHILSPNCATKSTIPLNLQPLSLQPQL